MSQWGTGPGDIFLDLLFPVFPPFLVSPEPVFLQEVLPHFLQPGSGALPLPLDSLSVTNNAYLEVVGFPVPDVEWAGTMSRVLCSGVW